MHGEHRVELLLAHLMEQHVAQIAGVVDDRVDAPERVERGLNDRMGAVPRGDAVLVRDGAPAGRANFVRDLDGHGVPRRGAVEGDAEIVDDDRGARFGELPRDAAPHAAPRSGHDRDLALHHAHIKFLNSS